MFFLNALFYCVLCESGEKRDLSDVDVPFNQDVEGEFIVDRDHVLYALTLSPEWEKTLDDSCQRTELGTMFLLNPMQVQDLIESTAMTLMRAHQSIGQQPVILCSPRIRLPLYQLLERHIPTIVVISYSELITDIKVEAVDTIGESSGY